MPPGRSLGRPSNLNGAKIFTRLALPAEPLSNCATSAQQTNPYGGLCPTVLLGDLLHFETFEIVPLENQAVVALAGFQYAANVDSCQIHSWRRQESSEQRVCESGSRRIWLRWIFKAILFIQVNTID